MFKIKPDPRCLKFSFGFAKIFGSGSATLVVIMFLPKIVKIFILFILDLGVQNKTGPGMFEVQI